MRFFEDLQHISENRCPAAGALLPYDTLEKALAGEPGASKFYHLLNGDWEFAYFDEVDDVPDPCGRALDSPHAGALLLGEPGLWPARLSECGLSPSLDMPYVPDEDPCGIYRRASAWTPPGRQGRPMWSSRASAPACACTATAICRLQPGQSPASRV